MFRTSTKLIAASAVLISIVLLAQKTAHDQAFVKAAYHGGMMEVHLGQLGVQKAMNDKTRHFAQMMIDDHSKGNDQLAALAKMKGIALPSEKLSDDGLGSKTGTDFDHAYAKNMVKDHEEDIAEFEKEANSGSDPEIRNWAMQTLPTLRSHLSEARTLPQ